MLFALRLGRGTGSFIFKKTDPSSRGFSSCRIRTMFTTRSARTKCSQIVVAVDSCTVTVVPSKLYSIIAHSPNFFDLRVRHRNKVPVGSVPLTQCARTVSPEVLRRILADVAIVPRNSNHSARLVVIYFSRVGQRRHKAQRSIRLSFKAVMNPILVRFTR